MNDTLTVLILKQQDYQDADVIVHVLNEDYGKLSLIASGARKISSKNSGQLLPYTLAEVTIDYRPEKTMFRLKTARTKKLYRHIHEDLEASSAAGFAAEAADNFTTDTQNVSTVYQLFKKTLDELEAGRDSVLVLSLYLSDLMKINGISPDVDDCVLCGRSIVNTFSDTDGGFLCRDCAAKKGMAEMNPSSLKRIRLLVKGSMNHLEIIENAGGAELADLNHFVEMIRLHAGIELKAYTLFRRIKWH